MKRHLAIGDVHGCANALTSLIDFIGLEANDTIIMLGDYVDRGPDSSAVIGLLLDLRASHDLIALRGNHEIMMLDARDKKSWRHAWLKYGGDATLQSYATQPGEEVGFGEIPEAHMDFLQNRLLAYFECETHFFVHANVNPTVPLPDQTDPALYWQKYNDPKPHCSGKSMVCGHTPQTCGLPLRNETSICIDTWAHGGGWLSCLDVESGTLWQANESGDRRTFSVEEIDSMRSDQN